MAQDDGRPPRLGADTLRSRAARSNEIYDAKQRARQEIVDEFETQDPDEIPVRRRGEGFGAPEAFFDRALPEEAAFQFDPQFPRQDLGPDDVRPADEGGFRPRERVERQAAAFDFEDEFGVFGRGELDPEDDIRTQDGGGFGLGREPLREVAAKELDEEIPERDIEPEDVEVSEADDGSFDIGLRGGF